jgi:2,5-diketo-D-gluconate reductase A
VTHTHTHTRAQGYTDPINEQIAAAIKSHPEIPRADLFVTTKLPCGAKNAGRPEMACADAQDCMRRNNALLQLPWTDLTLLHQPCGFSGGTSGTELTIRRWVQLEAGLAAGLTKAIGVSNFGWELLAAMLADPRVTVVPAVNQCDHAIANTNNTRGGGDDKTVQFCQSHGIAYSAYSPLQGLWSNSSVLDIPAVIAIGKAHNVSAAQVAFRWLIQQNISAVTAAHNPAYIKEDLDAFSFDLTAAEMATLSALGPPSPPPPPSACLQGATFRPGQNFENGKDVGSVMGTTASDCAAACCVDSQCGHFVYTTYMPSGVHQGQKMCWFKTAKAGSFTGGRPNCTSGTVPNNGTTAV